MTRYVALLRAINVGGHVVKMDRLRKLFEQLELGDVETFIASGNVIFQSRATNTGALERRIAAHLARALGYPVATFLRTLDEMGRIARFAPFAEAADGAALYVGFLPTPLPAPAKRVVLSMRTEVDDLRVRGRELYWRCRVRSLESLFSAGRLEKTLGLQATFRNVTTVRKLAAKYGATRG